MLILGAVVLVLIVLALVVFTLILYKRCVDLLFGALLLTDYQNITGWSDSCSVFFSFIFLSMHPAMCLSVSASNTVIHACTPARLASGNFCCFSVGKELFIRDLKNELFSSVYPTTKLFYANFQLTRFAS